MGYQQIAGGMRDIELWVEDPVGDLAADVSLLRDIWSLENTPD